jgi:hypothetical protein
LDAIERLQTKAPAGGEAAGKDSLADHGRRRSG